MGFGLSGTHNYDKYLASADMKPANQRNSRL
jgi:hypothetical protein